MQGVEIDDKHVEVMVRQMLRKVRIIEAGDTKLLPGSLVDIHSFTDANREAFKNVNVQQLLNQYCLVLQKRLLKLKASYQQHHSKTTRVLTDAAIKGKRDDLLGLKENVIIGKLIPAGTGMRRYSDVKYDKAETPVTETEEAEIIE